MTAAAVDDVARLERLLRRYPNDADIVFVVERLEPRGSRVRRRDAAIREAAGKFTSTPTAAAKALAAALLGYYRTAWPREQHMAVLDIAGTPHRALHTILRLNDGRPLAYRRILDICK